MSLKHTLLGILMFRPQTGYEIFRWIRGLQSALEPTTLRRIYPLLKRMADDGLVVYEVVPQEGKPDRKVYSLTDPGEDEFLSWLTEPPEDDPRSLNPFFIKLFFYGMLDKSTLLQRLHETLASQTAYLDTLDCSAIGPPRGPSRKGVDPERIEYVWRQLCEYERLKIETRIRWLQQLLIDIERDL